jgi:hypothetical protein
MASAAAKKSLLSSSSCFLSSCDRQRDPESRLTQTLLEEYTERMYLQMSHGTTAQRDSKDDDEDEALQVVALKP